MLLFSPAFANGASIESRELKFCFWANRPAEFTRVARFQQWLMMSHNPPLLNGMAIDPFLRLFAPRRDRMRFWNG